MADAGVTGAKKPSVSTRLISALSGHIDPVPISPLYKLCLGLVAAAMFVLPLIYIAIIGAALWGVYLHAVNNVSIIDGQEHPLASVLFYVLPMAMAGVLILFMIKPLFAPRPKEGAKLVLRRESEPLLFAFIERLCEVVGSPRPREIIVDCDVNASAGFRRGLLSFRGDDLALKLGLPMVAGLSVRQLTGVLAHEFGHFAQGTAMRLTYLIRNINTWFARVVYERDAWDQKLMYWRMSHRETLVVIIVAVVRAMVWLTRRLLWALMWIGHGASCLMLRQMEYDADRYEARVVGSQTFARTAQMLPLLMASCNKAHSDLSDAWQSRRLCDDLPAMVIFELKRMPEDVRKQIDDAVAKHKTGFFDTHPAERDRIASAQREDAPGIFAVDLPATALFSDFRRLSRTASLAFFREILGPEVDERNLVATDILCRDQADQEEAGKAFKRYVQGCLAISHPIFPGRRLRQFADADEAAQCLLDLRDQLQQIFPRAAEAVRQYQVADDQVLKFKHLEAMKSAGVTAPPAQFGLKRGDAADIIETRQQTNRTRMRAMQVINELGNLTQQRLQAGLFLATASAEPTTDEPGVIHNRIEGLLASAEAIERVFDRVLELRDDRSTMTLLLDQLKPDTPVPQSLAEQILRSCARCERHLQELWRELARSPYPYEHADGQISIAKLAISAIPRNDDVSNMVGITGAALEALITLYLRVMGDLAQIAEKTETSLGLAKLPEAKEVFSSSEQSA